MSNNKSSTSGETSLQTQPKSISFRTSSHSKYAFTFIAIILSVSSPHCGAFQIASPTLNTKMTRSSQSLHYPSTSHSAAKFSSPYNNHAQIATTCFDAHGSTCQAMSATSTSSGDDSLSDTGVYAVSGCFFLFLVAFFWTLVSMAGPGGWRFYLAGGICACFSHAITTPIDVIKTRQQVDAGRKEESVLKTGLSLIKQEGIQCLLAGLGPTTVGYLFEGAIKFGIYEVLKPFMRINLAKFAKALSFPMLDSRPLGFILCAAVSGVAGSVMLCPMEALRIRLVAEPDLAKEGCVDCGIGMLKKEGIMGMYKGMTAMMAKQVPYTITKQVSFDIITSLIYFNLIQSGFQMNARTKLIVPLVSAMMASFMSSLASQPGDMLLSVVNAHEGKKRTRDFSKAIMKKDGILGFFVGTKARLLHVGVIVTVQLFIYDFVKRLVGIAATGSAH